MAPRQTFRFGALLALLILSACGAKREYLVSDIQIQRVSWDTLNVQVFFEQRTTLGGTEQVETPDVEVRVFSHAGDTLYEGGSFTVPVPDAALGDREPLLVEVCGRFRSAYAVCGQHGLAASPKRVTVEQEIEYPVEEDYDRGRFRFALTAERQSLSDEEWTPIDWVGGQGGHLLVHVAEDDASEVIVPFRQPAGEFALSNLPNNADFRRELLSHLLADTVATVVFEVYVDAFDVRGPAAVVEKQVESKTAETRELEAGYFVEEVSRRIFDLVRTFPTGQDRWFFMNGWSFDRRTRSYIIDIELSWRSSFIRTRWFEMAGTVRVREDGTGARFELTSANDRGLRRWNQRFDDRIYEMGDLVPYPTARRRSRQEIGQ